MRATVIILEYLRLTVFLLLLSWHMGNEATAQGDGRTAFFPREETKVNTLPLKQNLWVFIMAGQSNMAGRGLVEPQDTVPDERILAINANNEIILAKEPLHFYEPSRTGLDCGVSFARTLLKQVPDGVSILLIPTAVGGSSTQQWLGDSVHRDVQLMTNFVKRVAIAKKYGVIKGILWHQGESDANEKDLPGYSRRLKELFTTFRQIIDDKTLPILIGELGSYSGDDKWMRINDELRRYSSTDINSAVIATSDLKPIADNIHFNSDGQRLMGERFAETFVRLMKYTKP